MSTLTPPSPPPVNYQSPAPRPPRAPWSERVNVRMIVFALLVLFLIGTPFYIWLQATLGGGIIHRGNFAEVDLKAMSTFDMDQTNGTPSDIPQRFRDLEGKPVILRGEMWQPQSAGDEKVDSFQLVYSKAKCCFSGPPLAQHFVQADVKPDAKAFYYDSQVDVYGTLHVKFRRAEGPGSKITNVYQVDVDKVEPVS